MPSSEQTLYQLPRDVRPVHYDLLLAPDLDRMTFSGTVSIEVEVYRDTLEFVLNAKDLRIHEARAFVGGADSPLEVRSDPEYERLILRGDRLFGAESRVVLYLSFSGEIGNLLAGLYKSQFFYPDGTDGVLVTTQFEATDARRAFPCWDEPSFKATFRMTARIDPRHVALSNMPAEREFSGPDGLKDVVFAVTPRMSTYLLHLTVGPLEKVGGQTENGVAVSVWTTPGHAGEGMFARDVALRLLPWFDDYFGIPYPLPKMDLVAIPDFAAGAMENWGILTYRETALLLPPGASSARTMQRVAIVVAHEMAHQWFGDLVTMSWWDDLWLNEGFASWMEVKAVDHLFPEWNMWDIFLAEDMAEGLELDGLARSHPIEVPVGNPHEINEIFDAISYVKGGSLIRMLEQFVGEETFRKGIGAYLKKFAYQNASTRDLWSVLGQASGQDIRSIMESWTRNMGYPVLISGETGQIEQKPFFNHPVEMERSRTSPDGRIWPVMLFLSSGKDRRPWLLKEEKAALPPPPPGQQWDNLNDRHTGFFRVLEDERVRKRRREGIKAGTVPVADRLGFSNDLFSLGRAGLLPLSEYLETLPVYRQEDQYIVWADIAAHLGWLQGLLAFTDGWERFDPFVVFLMQEAFRKAGWEVSPGDSHQKRLLRSLLLSGLGMHGDSDTRQRCQELFQERVRRPDSLHPDLRLAVYRTVASSGDPDLHRTFCDLARTADSQEEKNRLYSALAAFRRPDCLRSTLEFAISPAVRIQDTVSIVSQVGGNVWGEEEAWTFFRENFDLFRKRYEAGGFALQRLVKGVSEGFRSMERKEEVARFFASHPLDGAKRAIEQVQETIDLRAHVLARQGESLRKALSSPDLMKTEGSSSV
ncbi:M1 family metallopeptidase [Leptospirillum ferriphilum]|uniref:Aminopeptidase n=1 Tax=Leptospirillum ferriphilum (strain ML-04) TaxID=1048260 RepID=J9Z8V4_LEPFM|nr:M1 family metallopeptidase [Leptospirillum ferriphilum]AFS52616.1 putative aminopeptidase [Leptospirillum ferriphilum ML-04]OOH75351.1 aminopeptidase [Leptospirillum ferriphilum]